MKAVRELAPQASVQASSAAREQGWDPRKNLLEIEVGKLRGVAKDFVATSSFAHSLNALADKVVTDHLRDRSPRDQIVVKLLDWRNFKDLSYQDAKLGTEAVRRVAEAYGYENVRASVTTQGQVTLMMFLPNASR